jgi:hypothetical protein
MGPLKIFSKMGDYRQVEKIKLPFQLKQTFGPMEQILKFSSVTLDDVDPAVFELPAEIRALTEE